MYKYAKIKCLVAREIMLLLKNKHVMNMVFYLMSAFVCTGRTCPFTLPVTDDRFSNSNA